MGNTGGKSVHAPLNYDDLRAKIVTEYNDLSNRLQQVARFALDHPNDIALETTAVISSRAEVQPSTLIRFAKALGYDGFSEMQRLFRGYLAEERPTYRDRIAALRDKLGAGADENALVLLDAFVSANIAGLEHLREETSGDDISRAVEILSEARAIYVVAQRRAYALASYMFYSLRRLSIHAHLLDDVGGMLVEQASQIKPRDVLIAISYMPYTQRVIEAANTAHRIGAPIVAITDRPLSPLAGLADVCFHIEDAAVHDFRSLNASMCLAQTIVVSLGLRVGALRNDRDWGDTGDITS